MLKKVLFIFLWSIIFYIGTSLVLGTVVGIMIGFFSSDLSEEAMVKLMILSNVIAVFMFFISIFLGVRGKLPGCSLVRED